MRFNIIALVLLFTIALQAQAAKVISAPSNNVVVDGNAKEWPNPLPNFDKKTTLRYDIRNDSKNLYLIIRADDIELQKRIMTNGMDIWINKDGKQQMVTGVTYPMPMAPKAAATDPDVYQIDTLMLTGFYLENGKQGIRKCPIRVAIAKGDNNCMIYELSVPINSFWKEKLEKTDVKKAIQVGLILKGLDVNTMFNSMTRNMGGRTGGGRTGGGNMRGGGGFGGGGFGGDFGGMAMPAMNSNMMRNMKSMLPEEYQDKAVWFKAQLNSDF